MMTVAEVLNDRRVMADVLRKLKGHARANYYNLQEWHDEMISDACGEFCEDVEKFQRIWDAVEEKRCDTIGFVYGILRRGVRWLAMDRYNKARRQPHLALENTINSKLEEGIYTVPRCWTRAEQEDIVFYKQMIERCYRLPVEDRAMMMLVFDRATAAEMAFELGMEAKQVSHRVQAIALGIADAVK